MAPALYPPPRSTLQPVPNAFLRLRADVGARTSGATPVATPPGTLKSPPPRVTTRHGGNPAYSPYLPDVSYFRRTGPDYVIDVGDFQLEVTVSTGYAQDWVYGAAFSADGCGAYLATYSGKVIQISDKGIALRVYDLGSIPKEIVDTGEFLYLLTPTRLYVIEAGTTLTSFLDVYDQGRLIVTKLGFGLVAGKRFQWFAPRGDRIGEITTKHPIRTIFSSGNTTVIETRQHRAVIEGLRIA